MRGITRQPARNRAELDLRADGEERWVRLKGWNTFCTRQAHPKTIAHWSRMDGAGISVATGFGGLIGIDIDDNSLIDPVLKILPPVLVAKRGKKGLTAFYRGEHPRDDEQWWRKDNYRTAEKRGLLDFLAVGAQTVLPSTMHPDIGRPYEWTTERTLIDTPLADLPVFTEAHRAKMEDVLRQHGWDAPEPAQPRREAVTRPVRNTAAPDNTSRRYADFNRLVNATMAQWLPKLGLQDLQRVSGGWRAVASFRESGSDKTKRGQSLSIRDTGRIKDHAGEGYNAIKLVAVCLFNGDNSAAYAWLGDEVGFRDAPTATIDHPVGPTYADNRVSLDAAIEPLRAVFGDKFIDAILAGRAARNQARIEQPLILHVPPVEIVPSETGIGKTRAAIEGLTPLTTLGMKFVYAVPYHELADDVASDFGAAGVSVEVYRGYERPDPRAPKKHKMCRRPDAFKAVRELGIGTHDAICESRDGVARCPLAKRCGLMHQRKATPDVWIVPAALLFSTRPDFFPESDAVVIDESFIGNAPGDAVEIDVDALRNVPIDGGCNAEEQDAIALFRHRLRDAIKDNGDGSLSRSTLIDHGIDAETAWWLGSLERRPLDAVDLSPGMTDREVKAATKSFRAKATTARNASTMWHAIGVFLGEYEAEDLFGDRSLSGRLTVRGGMLLVTPFRTVHPSWREAPMVYLDATPPPARLVEIALGEIVTHGLPSVVIKHPEIAARWSDHVRVRWIVGAPATMTGVGVGERARKLGQLKPGNVTEIVSYIQLQAALAYPARIGVITYKELRERISGRLPDNIEWLHHGAVAGRNNLKEVAGLIVLGRLSAQRKDVEADASVFAGRPLSGGGDRFDHVPGGIRLVDGTAFGVFMERHQDPIAEAIRWLITEGNLIQAIGRLRPHRRNAPCWLDIIADVPLPVAAHEVVRWDDVKPRAFGAMAFHGVVLTNVSDAMSAFGLSEWAVRGVGGISNRESRLEIPPTPQPSASSDTRRLDRVRSVTPATTSPLSCPAASPASGCGWKSGWGRWRTLRWNACRRNTAHGSAMLEKIGRDNRKPIRARQ